MKQTKQLSRSRWLLLTLLSLLMTLGGTSPAWADELTLYNNENTSQYLPVNGYYADTKGNISEFVIPASSLSSMAGGTISSIKFYSAKESQTWGSAQYKVYVKEVINTSLTAYVGYSTSTVVYEGALSISSNEMTITFSTPFAYGDGNLLIGTYLSTAGTCSGSNEVQFYGKSDAGTNASRYKTSSENASNFLPKITLTYVPNGSFVSKPQNVFAGSITATGATIGWDAVDGADSYEICYSTSSSEPAEEGSYTSVNTNSYALAGLTSETTYYVYVRTIKGENHSKWSAVCSFTPGMLTINNTNTTTNNYVPIYGNYMDSKSICQFVLPKDALTSLNGTQITKMDFYGTISNVSKLESHTFEIYMGEVASATISELADWTTLENVYTGSLTIADGKMTINLDGGFDYNGENLLIGLKQTDSGSDYSATTWTGVSATGASLGGYASSVSQRNFLPQMSFYYAAQTTTVKKPKNLAASATATTTATLGWTDGEDGLTEWQIAYSTDTDFNPDSEGTKVAADANPFTLTELTAATTYYAYVRAKKGEDYSSWSNKVEFTTLAAAPVITLSTTSHNFGIVSDADAQALVLTISNTGGADLTGLTITPSTGFAVTDTEGNALTATTIAASSTLTIKVKVNAVGQQSGTITIGGTEIDAQVVTVSGYLLDNTKIAETFASASSVSRWTVASGWTFNATTGAYSGTSSRIMTTPKISVSEGNGLALNVKLGWSGGSLIVEGLDAEGNTVYNPVTYNSSNGGLNTTDFTLITISDMPTTVAKVKLTGYYAYINLFNGFSYAPDPVLALYSDEDCTVAQAATATKNFGFVTETQQQKYYIKNTGTGQIDLTIEQADGFTAAVDDAALTEGEKATLTISMAATEGLHDGTLTVTAKNHDTAEVVGTFEVALNGAVAGSKNDVNFASLSNLPAAWETTGWTVSANNYVQNNSGTSKDLTTATLTVADSETLLVEAQGSNNWNAPTLFYSYKAGDAEWTDATEIAGVTYNNWKIYSISGIPAGDVKVKFSGTNVRIRRVYGFTAKAEPYMVFAENGTTKNFGMITADATSDSYTITNSGAGVLNGLTVTCDNSNYVVTVADNKASIDANGGTATFTIKLKADVKGQQNGTVTISGTGVETKTLTVKGYVADDTKIFETFTSLPSRWKNTGWTFTLANGASTTNSSFELESPKIVVAEDQKLAISAKLQYSGSYYVTINGSSDNGVTWTAYTKTLNNTQLNNTDYTVVELDDIPTTVNKLQLVGYYVYVNGLNGFTYDENDPKFSMFSDSECESAIAETTATNAWGFVSEDKSATYYIKNTGTGTMTLAASAAPAGFTATLGKTSLAANESTSLVISMANDAENNEGYHAGDVVLTAKDNAENTLGTFTVTSSGVVVGSKTDINFTTLSDVPAGWDKGNWTVTANTKVAVGYSSGSLTTGTYTITEGESMVIKAKKQSNYGTLTYSYSTDNGENWSNAQTITPNSTSYELIAISGIPAGKAKIKFTGTYIDIERIYGYTAVLEPAMSLEPAAASYDFGMQTAAAEYVITVTNDGTAVMNNLAASLETDTDYSVAITKPEGESTTTITDGKATVPVGQSAIITVTQKFDAAKGLASLSDVLTISADDVASKAITLSGKTRDASKWYVDFSSGIPTSFIESNNWEVYNNDYACAGNTEATLATQTIDVAAGEKLQLDAKLWQNTGYLKVRYSVNGGISWSDETTYNNSTLNTSEWNTILIDMQNDAAATAMVELKGYYIYIDNVYGGTLNNSAPMISVKKGGVAVETGTTEEFGSITAEQTATYTITNVGNGTLTITSPLTVTGVATASVNETSLTNGQSATLTITMPAEYPYGTKDGVVTVVTNLGNFVINYTATILNPNALDEQFASGKPAGWYFGGYWEVDSQQAQNSASGVADLITEQLTVADASDALTFEAARTSSTSAPTFKVYVSQDRVEWTEFDLSELTLTTSYQTVTVSGLAAGDYYVKISGARVKVDNFLGWTKKNNSRDLYVTATSYPADTQNPSTENLTASVTVTSLIAAESGIYAKLFINNVETATATSADVALRGSQTFSMNYTAPATAGTYTAQIKVYYSDNNVAFTTAVQNLKVYLLLDETVAPSLSEGEYDVQLNRSFTANSWNTICLPFAVADITAIFGVNAKAFEYKGFNNNTLNFDNVTALEAGKPYLLHVTTEVGAPVTFSNVSVTETKAGNVELNGVTFQGTYAPIAAPDLQGKYGVGTDNKLHKGSTNATMNGFRGYFIGELAGARISTFDETTGITNVYATEGMFGDQRVYNLNGQHVENAKKGVFIVNGKKVVVK